VVLAAGTVACAAGTTDQTDASQTEQTDASTAPDAEAGDAGPDSGMMESGAPDASPSCSNNAKDGAETDVDCGGPACPKCADGKSCMAPADCAAGACFANKCGARMWLTESSGSNLPIPGNQTWIPVDLKLSPTLYAPSLVALRWTGTVRFVGGGNGICHVGQRFVVDGAPTGNPTWGDAIMVQNGSRWHESFTDEIAVPLAAGTHTIAVEMTNASGYATCNLDGDGGLPYDRSRLGAVAFDPQSAWYSESNAETGPLGPNGPWTNIPGVFAAFTLASKQHVQVTLTGSQLAQGPGPAHCDYRLVVDGSGLGDANYGQAISIGDNAQGWWAPVVVKYGADIMPGAHTIQAQVRNYGGAGGGTCNAGQGNNAYARFRMLVTASPLAARRRARSRAAAPTFSARRASGPAFQDCRRPSASPPIRTCSSSSPRRSARCGDPDTARGASSSTTFRWAMRITGRPSTSGRGRPRGGLRPRSCGGRPSPLECTRSASSCATVRAAGTAGRTAMAWRTVALACSCEVPDSLGLPTFPPATSRPPVPMRTSSAAPGDPS
jgi:hypothetical protein